MTVAVNGNHLPVQASEEGNEDERRAKYARALCPALFGREFLPQAGARSGFPLQGKRQPRRRPLFCPAAHHLPAPFAAAVPFLPLAFPGVHSIYGFSPRTQPQSTHPFPAVLAAVPPAGADFFPRGAEERCFPRVPARAPAPAGSAPGSEAMHGARRKRYPENRRRDSILFAHRQGNRPARCCVRGAEAGRRSLRSGSARQRDCEACAIRPGGRGRRAVPARGETAPAAQEPHGIHPP